jgi:hypothetical protein
MWIDAIEAKLREQRTNRLHKDHTRESEVAVQSSDSHSVTHDNPRGGNGNMPTGPFSLSLPFTGEDAAVFQRAKSQYPGLLDDDKLVEEISKVSDMGFPLIDIIESVRVIGRKPAGTLVCWSL